MDIKPKGFNFVGIMDHPMGRLAGMLGGAAEKRGSVRDAFVHRHSSTERLVA